MQIVKIDAMKKIRHENDNCIVAYTYLKTNKCQKNLLALYVYTT